MFCAQCGTLVSANSKFCVACGQPVTNAEGSTLALGGTESERLLNTLKRGLAAEYDVERELGRGGMAIVYKAREIELDRPVALKVLPPELGPVGSVADRFKREARLAASLDHPNVIPVYRVGQAGGIMYMAMKFIDGKPLDAVLDAYGALPLPVILIVLRSAAAALAFAHEHGIIHRDIKGANILVDRDAKVVVSDFGIARAVESGTLTATGAMIGTPHFMSPEQCAGKPVGPQSDQYSLGIVAYQMLTGSVPFDGDSLPEIIQHHWFTPVADYSLMRPDTPAALTVAVLRLLEKDPAKRFGSTQELVATLDAIRQTDADRAAGETLLRSMVRGTAPRPRTSGARVSGATPAAGTPTATPAPEPTPPARTPRPSSASRRVSAKTAKAASAPTTPLPLTPLPITPPAQPPRPPAKPATAIRRPPVKPKKKKSRVLAFAGSGLALVAASVVALGLVRQHAQAMPRVPRTASAMRTIADHEYATAHYEMARRFYVRALALDSTDAGARRGLACASDRLGRGAVGVGTRGCD
ncbi:MAG TPA: serine/threonine-protein kinase [Gemmatimonadaceae bacterium]|nr:serine/threonine-protein kinase [Gemmatimonadaceae bacterium]